MRIGVKKGKKVIKSYAFPIFAVSLQRLIFPFSHCGNSHKFATKANVQKTSGLKININAYLLAHNFFILLKLIIKLLHFLVEG